MSTTIITPSSRQHKRLKNINDGKEDTSVSPETLGSLYQDDDLKVLAWDYYSMEVQSRRDFEPYMEIDEPVPLESYWVVRKHLTPLGQKVLEAMNVGWFWNTETNQEAIQETFNFYRDLMKSNKFTVVHADWIVGNQDERFRELRNEVVYFKLKAKRVGDVFVEDLDAR